MALQVTAPIIFTQCYLTTEEQGRLLGVAMELLRRLNPGVPFMLIDNASPLPPQSFVPRNTFEITKRFDESIGHLSEKFAHEREKPQDGPGRAMMTALELALNNGYTQAIYAESDALFAVPLVPYLDKMTKPTACCPRIKWGYLDWQAWWIKDLPWLVNEHKFIEKYDWRNQTGKPEGERVYERILGPFLQVHKLRGGRADGQYLADGTWHQGWLHEGNIRTAYPQGIDYITHCDTACFKEFLRMNQFDDLAERL